MPPVREYIFICTQCEPMFAETLISVSALTAYAQSHAQRHSLGRGHSRLRVMTIVSSPVEEFDTPELEAVLRWESHERSGRSSINVEEAGEEGPGG